MVGQKKEEGKIQRERDGRRKLEKCRHADIQTDKETGQADREATDHKIQTKRDRKRVRGEGGGEGADTGKVGNQWCVRTPYCIRAACRNSRPTLYACTAIPTENIHSTFLHSFFSLRDPRLSFADRL